MLTTTGVLLLVIGALGAFDIAWFHHHQAHLSDRAESRTEARIHVIRGFVYTLQFALVPNVRFTGWCYAFLVLLFVADASIAAADVLVEPSSRKGLGGLAPGEYLMHIVLSVLVGAMLHSLFAATLPWASLPSGVALAPAMPGALRLILGVMAASCLAVALYELALLVPPKPGALHIRARVKTSLDALWTFTQDHLRHPEWDHRFSRITMLAPEIRTGTMMRYEKDLLGVTIGGFGKYKLHRPMKQSTFEFWSDDPRSLIRHGVGLWLYRPLPDGTIDFSTAYTYDVRWGLAGRVIDRLLFRPLMLRATARSFRRLVREHFPGSPREVESWLGRAEVTRGSRVGGVPARSLYDPPACCSPVSASPR